MRKLWSMALLVMLTACGTAATGGMTTQTAVAESPVPSAAPSAAAAPTMLTGGSALAAGSIEIKAAQVAAAQAKLSSDAWKLVNKAEQQWSNSSLGCPAADRMYSQVITPGFLLTYTDGAKSYEVHSDTTGERAVLCAGGKPVAGK